MSAARQPNDTCDLAIVDPCSSRGYAPSSLAMGGLGGTEATVLRVAGALSQDLPIIHYQKGRTDVETSEAGRMVPLTEAFTPNLCARIIVINSWKVACKLRRLNPDATIFLWLHIFPGRHNRPMGEALAAARIRVLCVSRSHARHLRAFTGNDARIHIDHVYNPIADDLHPNSTLHDPDRLLFASSPHKGLAEVYRQFRTARAAIPGLTLAVADPGYLAWDTGPVPDGVIRLGKLSHADLIAELRRALGLFYPQTTFAETFGLVLAEAGAVGTPVLVHRGLGANDEVAASQAVDCTDPASILARLRQWRDARPVVRTNPAFRMNAVVRHWAEILVPAKTARRRMVRKVA